MSDISMMELNAKNPFLWDLENLVMFNTNTGEAPKTLQLVDSEIEGTEAFEVGSFYSSGSRSDGGTGSDYSSTDRDMKETNFSLETNDCFQQDLRGKRTSPTIESSGASGESLIALELFNRTYFEDISGASNVKMKNAAQTSISPGSSGKKSKSSSLSLEISRCQVEGCNVELSSAKDYHRKHKVCESHAKCPRVVINGHERRFCQQCSRFHSLSEFDQKKRSCRRRLSDHNARRRKPKPEVIQFNPMRLATSLYEGRNQLNFGFNQVPVLHTRQGAWENTRDSKVTQAKSGLFDFGNSKGTNGLPCTYNGVQSPVTKVSPVSNHFLPSKGAPPEVYHQGLLASMAPSNIEAAQNLSALSLLSTSYWGSNNASLPAMHEAPLAGPPVSSGFWIAEQQPGSGPGSHTPSFQLFKASDEASFYLY